MTAKTVIIATLGPASDSPEMIEQLVNAGVNIFRLNFSHGNHKTHLETIKKIRNVAAKIKKEIGILGDLCGPKIRTGNFADGHVQLKPGDLFYLSQNPDQIGTEKGVGTNYPHLVKDLNVDNIVLLDDGRLKLKAHEVQADKVIFQVLEGGKLSSNKGINMPNVDLSIETITEKDKQDLKFIIDNDLDFVALSFVRSAKDMIDLKTLLGKHEQLLIAKIEKPEAIEAIDSILDQSDGIMIARGDLGVEMPVEKVPSLQKELLERCSRLGKTVITATQMLDSMINNQLPTRAETTDVFNAVIEGSDAIMLSGETAIGRYPLQAVKMMNLIAKEAEHLKSQNLAKIGNILPEAGKMIENIMAHSACEAAMNISAKAIVPFTHSGKTAINISKYHPPIPVYALTPKTNTCRRLSLSWGVTPIKVEDLRNTDMMIEMAEKTLRDNHLVSPGDIIVIIAGVPLGVKGNTNTMKIHTIR